MTDAPSRQFTLLDAMALVAATAFGLAAAMSRSVRGFVFVPLLPDPSRVAEGYYDRFELWLRPITQWVVASGPIMAMWTLAILALRLRHPRPRRCRLFAPPGIAACCVALATLGFDMAGDLAECVMTPLSNGVLWVGINPIRRRGLDMSSLSYSAILACSSRTIGSVVAAFWIWMAVAGRWRPEPTWLDRAGRILGTVWIVMVPLRFWFDSHR